MYRLNLIMYFLVSLVVCLRKVHAEIINEFDNIQTTQIGPNSAIQNNDGESQTRFRGSLRCDRYDDILYDVTNYLWDTDILPKTVIRDIKNNVSNMDEFTPCFELALIGVELGMQSEEESHVSNSVEHADKVDNVGDSVSIIDLGEESTRDSKKFSLSINIGKGKSSKSKGSSSNRKTNRPFWRDRGSDRWDWDDRCWVDSWCGGRSRWDDRSRLRSRWRNRDRFNSIDFIDDDCYCDDSICCDCEPDRGGRCCRNWCEFFCEEVEEDEERDRRSLMDYCDDSWNWCDPICQRFEHCCCSRCLF